MKTIRIILLVTTVFFSAQKTVAQWQDYHYWQEIAAVAQADWYQITLSDSIYGRLLSGTNDIRIIGITAQNDTIVAPHIVLTGNERIATHDISFQIINNARSKEGHYFTLRPTKRQDLNQIDLQLENRNFDWKIRLEASHDQQQWFTLLNDYRITAIHNADTQFRYTTLNFPTSNYAFYRIFIPTEDSVTLHSAKTNTSLDLPLTSSNEYIATPIITENQIAKTTEIELTLPFVVPISEVAIQVEKPSVYSRKMYIKTATDSVRYPDDSYQYRYQNTHYSIISSEKDNHFLLLSNSLAKKIHLTIYNEDDNPLTISSVQLRGNPYRIVTRIDEPDARYYLIYGKKNDRTPYYDISAFPDKIPHTHTALTLGKTIRTQLPVSEGIFGSNNRLWIWIATGIIVILLVAFSVKMLRENPKK